MSAKTWKKIGAISFDLFTVFGGLAMLNLAVVNIFWEVMIRIKWLPYVQIGLLVAGLASLLVSLVSIGQSE